MVSAPRKGLSPARKAGSGPDNKGLTTYAVASEYGTSIGAGDPVKLSSGTLVVATNGDDAIGVFQGISYIDAFGLPVWSQKWTASVEATNIEAMVLDDPAASFMAVADGPIPLVIPGDIFALNLTAPDAATGRSTMTVKTTTTLTGDVDIDGVADLGAAALGITDGDTFTIRTTQVEAGSAVTITIADGDGTVDLLAALNAVDNISASLDSSGFLVIAATDGYDIVTVEGTGTPFAALMGVAAGTFSEVVAANAGLVKVLKVIDTTNRVLEVVLVNHSYRDDG